MSIISDIRSKAKSLGRRVLLPEAEQDIRVIRAANIIRENGLATPVLIGNDNNIYELAEKHDVKISDKISVLPVNDYQSEQEKTHFFKEKLAHKNPTEEQVQALCRDPLFTAGWLLEKGEADTVIAGSIASTPDVIRAALRTVGVASGSSIISSTFLMEMPNGKVFTYADCGVVPYPDSKQLASIALDSGKTHQLLTGVEPRIAFLSFSTKGSAQHERVDLVREAFELARKQNETWDMDGELQFDAAYMSEIAHRKAPDSPLAGRTNVFIFPNLDAGNIAYKITERLAGAVATGPILQGLSKPYLDLSRGCSVDDIVNAASVGALLSTK
ncbi:phosphotransacetylase [Rhodohalobacter sulfatireducens]|uniref:Phosphotransacetylase n=1 Tax=Rhodohalobacter sulfatireducens TaxID=2911366 RepID=A0ABS9KF65_9BACT|nr:phosphotransacetylase [Rhodohalobacter sulfatireducens]MCG2589432.1 phosphotransacetylase [Rhodohalobacter sulfatireducens]